VLLATLLWCFTITYTCPDSVGMTTSTGCDAQGGVEMVTRTIVAVIGFGFALWFAVKAVRATPRR